MSDLLIKPKELEAEIKKYEGLIGTVKSLSCEVSVSKTDLTCIGKYLECIEKLQEAIDHFVELSESDAKNLELIKADWLGIDNKIANQMIQTSTP